MNKSCVRRLPGSGHGGGRVCWAPRLAGKGPLQTPSCRGTAPSLLAGPGRTGAVSRITTGLSWTRRSPYSEVVQLLPAHELGPIPRLGVSLCFPPLLQQRSPEDSPGRGTPALVHPERGVCQDRQTHPERKACSSHNSHSMTPLPRRTCGHTQRWIYCHSQRVCTHARAHTHMGPHREMHMGLHGRTQICTHTAVAHPPSA